MEWKECSKLERTSETNLLIKLTIPSILVASFIWLMLITTIYSIWQRICFQKWCIKLQAVTYLLIIPMQINPKKLCKLILRLHGEESRWWKVSKKNSESKYQKIWTQSKLENSLINNAISIMLPALTQDQLLVWSIN